MLIIVKRSEPVNKKSLFSCGKERENSEKWAEKRLFVFCVLRKGQFLSILRNREKRWRMGKAWLGLVLLHCLPYIGAYSYLSRPQKVAGFSSAAGCCLFFLWRSIIKTACRSMVWWYYYAYWSFSFAERQWMNGLCGISMNGKRRNFYLDFFIFGHFYFCSIPFPRHRFRDIF